MAKIVDPDQLNQATEVVFGTTGKTVDLAIAGNLDDNNPGKSSGVAHQALYSFTKEEWLVTAGLRKLKFPFKAIFEAKFEWINTWQPNDVQTVDLIRDGGFRVVLLDDEYACIISLGSTDAVADQGYLLQTAGFAGTKTDFDKSGELNENILIFDGTTDNRGFLKTFLREEFKTFAEGNLLVDQDLSALTYQAYRLPLANVPDPNYTVALATIDATTPYTNFEVTYLKGSGFTTYATATVYAAEAVVFDATAARWYFTLAGGTSSGANVAADVGVTWEAYVGERQVGTPYYAFNRILRATSGTGTKEDYYNWAQRNLLSTVTADINADTLGTPNQDGFGVVKGNIARPLLDFVGISVVTRPGVYVDNLDSNDFNSIEYSDITVDGGGLDSESVPLNTTKRLNPFVSAGNIQFADVIVAETNADTYFTMFFDYTTRNTATDFATTAPTTDTYTLTSGTLDLTTRFTGADYVRISGFANPLNNGMFTVASVVAGSMDCTRIDGQNVAAAEAVGPTVNLDENPYDSPDAIIVDDNTATDIEGTVTTASEAFTFDYDGNVQGGRTAATDAVVTIEVSGLVSTWVDGTFTISRASGLSFPLNPAEDAVYLNP